MRNKIGKIALDYACKYKAPTEVIMELTRFHDSGDDTIKEIVNGAIEGAAIADQHPVVHIAAEYGLNLSDHITKQVESNDNQTGLLAIHSSFK